MSPSSALGQQVSGLAARLVRPVTTRKYLAGAILAWVLIVYVAAAPSEIVAPAPRSAPTRAVPPPALAAGPAPSASVAPAFSPEAPPPEPAFDFSPISFPAPPPPPPAAPPLSCPFPIPQAQNAPLQPGIFLTFEGPLIEMSGPLAAYDLPTLGEIGPLVPILTPLVSISQPVLNEVTPNLSVTAGDFEIIANDLGLNSPQSQQYAQEFEPYWLQLVGTFTPFEQTLASSTPGQCLVLFENALAVAANEQNVQLPPLPLLPSGLPPGSSQSAVAVAAATTADTPAPFAQLVLPWSAGVPAGLAAALSALRAKGDPIELELVDQPPAGQSMGTTGFADFVAQVVHEAPQASAVQVDAASTDPAGAAQIADLVHGLAAADFVRQPGQLIGVGMPDSAQGAAATGFWRAFAGAIDGYQASMVDFVGADLTPVPAGSTEAESAEAAATAQALRTAWSTLGGVPADVPLFATVGLATSIPVSIGTVQEQIAAAMAALVGQRVVALGIATR